MWRKKTYPDVTLQWNSFQFCKHSNFIKEKHFLYTKSNPNMMGLLLLSRTQWKDQSENIEQVMYFFLRSSTYIVVSETCTYIEKGNNFDGLSFRSLFLLLGWILEVFSWSVYILFICKLHTNTEIRDQNLSPSKVVTFLYIRTCLSSIGEWKKITNYLT